MEEEEAISEYGGYLPEWTETDPDDTTFDSSQMNEGGFSQAPTHSSTTEDGSGPWPLPYVGAGLDFTQGHPSQYQDKIYRYSSHRNEAARAPTAERVPGEDSSITAVKYTQTGAWETDLECINPKLLLRLDDETTDLRTGEYSPRATSVRRFLDNVAPELPSTTHTTDNVSAAIEYPTAHLSGRGNSGPRGPGAGGRAVLDFDYIPNDSSTVGGHLTSMNNLTGHDVFASQQGSGSSHDCYSSYEPSVLYDSSFFIPCLPYVSGPQRVANTAANTAKSIWNTGHQMQMQTSFDIPSLGAPVHQQQDTFIAHPQTSTPSQTNGNDSFSEPVFTPGAISEEGRGTFTLSKTSVSSDTARSQPHQDKHHAPAPVARTRRQNRRRQHNQGRFQCPICSYNSAEKRAVQRHIDDKHNEKPEDLEPLARAGWKLTTPVPCSLSSTGCTKKFRRKDRRKRHEDTVHRDQKPPSLGHKKREKELVMNLQRTTRIKKGKRGEEG